MSIFAMEQEFSEADLLAGLSVAETIFGLEGLEKLLGIDRELTAYFLCLMHEGRGDSLFQSSVAALHNLMDGGAHAVP